MIYIDEMEKIERKQLKPYACFSDTAWRVHSINRHPIRTEFQRDRDRIIHSKCFRRLEFKTQVYLSVQSDHMRTRLTHSLEVSQIARTIANQLGLNLDLVEAIALGHDVGHTPFGHAAEKQLDIIAKTIGLRFKHNMQGIRIFEELEQKYQYNGLALTIPVLEGILKHTSFYTTDDPTFKELNLENEHSFTLEGQAVAIADEIAQITHDTDDFLRANVLKLNDFLDHELFDVIKSFYKDRYDFELDSNILHETTRKEIVIRCLVDFLVTILIEETEKALSYDLRAYEISKNYFSFGEYEEVVSSFHQYLNDQCLGNYGVLEMDKRGKEIVATLFDFYSRFPERMPTTTQDKFTRKGPITILDYISGMTDKYAIDRYNSIIEI